MHKIYQFKSTSINYIVQLIKEFLDKFNEWHFICQIKPTANCLFITFIITIQLEWVEWKKFDLYVLGEGIFCGINNSMRLRNQLTADRVGQDNDICGKNTTSQLFIIWPP